MKLVIQRVSSAAVEVEGEPVARIGNGLLVLVGAEESDTPERVRKAAQKSSRLRIFEDAEGRTNLDIRAVGGEILVVSQFTLCADTSRGNRPSFAAAAAPELAADICERYVTHLKEAGIATSCGRFGAQMNVTLTNRGPFTIMLDIH